MIFSYSENEALASELVTPADELAKSLAGEAFALMADQVTGQPRGRILLLKAGQQISDSRELVASAIAAAAGKFSPSLILVGSTRSGREVAAKLAIRLNMGILSEVRNLRLQDGQLLGERSVYSGKFIARVGSRLPCIATVPSGAYPRSVAETSAVETFPVEPLSGAVKRIETRPKPKASVDLKTASIIVSAGRGIKRKEDLALVEQLANALGGVVGSSRPLSSDLGWLGEEHHIGLTGVYVHPDLYLAVGISGQLQHIAGIRESKVIAAINKDKQAPIFQVSDYGVVGDLYQVVPALLKLLEGKSAPKSG